MAEPENGTSFGRVAVIGTGLIGCSLAALLKGRGVVDEVIGIDRQQAHLEMAERLGFIDRGRDDAARGVMGAEAIVLAVPLDEVFKVMDAIGPDVRPGAVICCAAGTTARLRHQLVRFVRSAENLVPGYPLVHLRGQGAGAAAPGRLDGRTCLLAAGGPLPHKAVDRAEALWAAAGLRPQRLAPDAFEAAVAGSGLWPELLALALGRVAGRGGWPAGQTALQTWLDGMDAPVELNRCHQLYAGRLSALIDELIGELQRQQQRLGAGSGDGTDCRGNDAARGAGDGA